MMNPADTAISELSEPVGEMTHEDYYKAATKSLPGAGLGSYSLPDDVRFVIHKGDGSRLQDVRGRWYIDYVGGAGAGPRGGRRGLGREAGGAHAEPQRRRLALVEAPRRRALRTTARAVDVPPASAAGGGNTGHAPALRVPAP